MEEMVRRSNTIIAAQCRYAAVLWLAMNVDCREAKKG
jgi:hypothetical protein